jgi:glycosyltransferase involved in cell wall biosynthesis
MGFLHNDVTLALLYGAADVMVVPSRQENLVQTGVEAQACGRPVVAFDSTGTRDVAQHLGTGYLVRLYDMEDLAAGIAYTLEDDARRIELGRIAGTRCASLVSIGRAAAISRNIPVSHRLAQLMQAWRSNALMRRARNRRSEATLWRLPEFQHREIESDAY